MTSETESLLYDCRAALLQHSDEQLAALFECWFEFLIDDESMEEVLDDLLLLLGYRMRSWGTKISYASYTAWWEVEGYLAPEGGVFDCADAASLRQHLLRIPIEQFGRVMELIYHVRLVAAQIHGESGLPRGVVATWDIRTRNSDLDKSPCGGRGGASKIRRYHSALTHLQLAHFHEGAIYSVSRLLISIRQLVFFCLHRLQQCFLRWTKPPQASLLLGMAVDLARGKSELVAENALLRQQLILLRRQVRRPVCTGTDRLLLVLLARAVRTWRQALFLVQPETLLRGPRQGFRLFWKYKSKAPAHQPRTAAETWPRTIDCGELNACAVHYSS